MVAKVKDRPTAAKRAQVVDLDACTLLEEREPPPRPPAPIVVDNKRARPKATAVLLPPRDANKRKVRRDAGRDEMLSEYLSSLGRIPLLTPEEEKEIAARLRDAEVRCWKALLVLPDVCEALVDADPVKDGPEGLRQALAAGDLDAVAALLREVDDDRSVIDEMLATAARVSGTAQRTRTLDEARELRRRAVAVRNEFVQKNLRLVVSVARRFHHYRLPLIDLIQEGNLGLIKSVHRFDHTKGFRFSTYAHWWIRQAIERAIMNKGASVRLPVHVFDARREVQKATRDLQSRLGREPSHEELARELAIPLEKLDEILRAVPREPQSLDEAVGDDEDRTLGEVLCDELEPLPDERVIQRSEESWVRRVLTKLTPMEVDIMKRRFGLDTDDDETLEEIGVTYNLSRERVRQIQVQGIKKMQRFVALRDVHRVVVS